MCNIHEGEGRIRRAGDTPMPPTPPFDDERNGEISAFVSRGERTLAGVGKGVEIEVGSCNGFGFVKFVIP